MIKVEQLKTEIYAKEPHEVVYFIQQLLENYPYDDYYDEATNKYGDPTQKSLLAIIDLLTRQ
ncbi:MAG: hypothetical protein R3321_01180 [Nitrososphaeraceae archaeon]|nr:hypothetical protein [Nitrososphaeraceae archaeon]